MIIRRLIATGVVLIAVEASLESTWGQAPEANSDSSVQDSEREANRSGLTEADRGSFEATTETEGLIGRNAENVSKMLRELRGTKQQQRSIDVSVDNLNERRNARSRRRSQQNPPPQIHVKFQPSFGFPVRPVAQVARGIQTRISRLLDKREAGSVRIEMVDRTAILTGTVRSEYEQKLLERMVRIEPGVSTVKNLIVVEGPLLAPGN